MVRFRSSWGPYESPAQTVRIYGMAKNLAEAPAPLPGIECWPSNSHKGYATRYPVALQHWTRWFNLHSRKHMDTTYPAGVEWYKNAEHGKPIYFQKHQPDIPGSVVFPRAELEAFFPEAIGPNGNFYATCSVCWLIALAIYMGFKRIELWGFMLRDTKSNKDGIRTEAYKYERPCFFYWVKQARDRGIEVFYQKAVQEIPFEPGDPSTYTGPVYGYETKPEE